MTNANGEVVQGEFTGMSAPDVLTDYGLEGALIGALMLQNDLFGDIAFLTPEDFAWELHEKLFALIQRRIEAGRAATITTLQREFADSEARDVALLAANAGPVLPTDVLDYARTLQDIAIRRRLRTTLGEGQRRILADNDEYAPLIAADIAADMAAITKDANGTDPTASAGAIADIVLDDIERLANGEAPRGVTTGLAKLDEAIGLMEPGELWVIGARPGMGKSALMLTMAMAIAEKHGPAFVVSLEMSARQIGRRLISAISGVPGFTLRRGWLENEDMTAVADARNALDRLPLSVYVDRDTSVEAVIAHARRMHQSTPLAALFIDYLQLMRSNTTGQRENRVQELTTISGALKSLALELDIPVIALSQLNRGVESREDKRPNTADIRESGAIEQDADGVLMLYRAEEYHRREKPNGRADAADYADWQAEHALLKGRAEIIIAKHRSGEGGASVECGFHGPTTTFRDDPPFGDDTYPDSP